MSEANGAATPQSLIREELLALSAYHVPASAGMVKLDAMENPYSLPEDLAAGLGVLLGTAPVNRYPEADARALKAAIRRALSLSISTNTTGVVYKVSSWLSISPPTIAIPSGCRSSAPSPVPRASGTAPSIAAKVVMSIGLRRSDAALKIAAPALFCPARCLAIAKSVIMIAFFFTMPMSSMTAIRAMIENCVSKSISASSAPTPAEGSVDRMVTG